MKRCCRGGLVVAVLVVSAALVRWPWVGTSSDPHGTVGSADPLVPTASPSGTQAIVVGSTVAATRDASADSVARLSGGDPQSGDHAPRDGGATDLPFDVHAVMERVHFAFRPEADQESVLEGGHSTYGVRVEQGPSRCVRFTSTATPRSTARVRPTRRSTDVYREPPRAHRHVEPARAPP
ncbi:MAG: hypothetical protein KC668_19305 [Myxococcales bacterium]|nr:hypothetical protein [Myxococcales bacterium]